MISNVAQVIGVATKKDGSELRGVGKKGEWVMYSVILEDGKKLNVFGPVSVGDTVYDLVQDYQYHSWSGKVKRANASTGNSKPDRTDMSQPTNAQVLEAVREVYKLLKEIRTAQKGELGEEPMTQDKFNKEVVLEDLEGEDISSMIDSSQIPF